MGGTGDFDPTRALAVVMGASQWEASAYEDNVACRNSAEAFYKYVVDPNGLGLREDCVRAVIDDDSQYPHQILEKLQAFLADQMRAMEDKKRPAKDLFFYYVGHGAFSESNDYFLPILKTRGPDFEGTSIGLDALAKFIKAAARGLRSHLIFDACFSAATFKAFLAPGPADVAAQQALHAFPATGIALLCSAGRSDPALAPEGLRETMFTGELMRLLREGDKTAPKKLSFSDLAELVSERLQKQFTDVIRPHVSSPRQKDGQVHLLRIFPNVLFPNGDDDETSTDSGDPPPNGDPEDDFERFRVKNYTLTDSQWKKVPKEVQKLLIGWKEELFVGYGAVAISAVCLLMAAVAFWLGPNEDASGIAVIMRIAVGMSGGAAVLLFIGSVALFALRSWRPKVPMLGPKASSPQEWEEYEIMDGLRARNPVYLLGNSAIGHTPLTVTMLLTLAAISIWVLHNWRISGME